MTCSRLFDHRYTAMRGHEVLGCNLKLGHKRACVMEWRPATDAEIRVITESRPTPETARYGRTMTFARRGRRR